MSDITQLYQSRIASGALHPDPVQEALLPEFERILEALKNPPRRKFFRKTPEPAKGLYLWGGVGRGKSMLMDLLVDSLGRVPARRVHFHAFMQEIHAAMHVTRQRRGGDAILPVAEDVAARIRLLAFDEMQITDITDAMIVGRLFEALFAESVVVVTTSNRPPGDLYQGGLNRQLFLPFIGLIHDRMTVWHLDSPTDYRRGLLHGAPVWFTPVKGDTRARIDAIWQELAGGPAAPLSLDVLGRAVEIPLFRNGVARASFYDLCGKPLGPADYLALAQAVKVLVLEDIPRLSRSNYNEARRFVILIDALYEARVRLIASAAAQPEMLYVEGGGAFEFERTVSRLREMQGADWGH
jgi:cell division protein ZapE